MSFIYYDLRSIRANIPLTGISGGRHEYNTRQAYARPRALILKPSGEHGGEDKSIHRAWRGAELAPVSGDELLFDEAIWCDRAPGGALTLNMMLVGMYFDGSFDGVELPEGEDFKVDLTLRTLQLSGPGWATVESSTETASLKLYPMRYLSPSRVLRMGCELYASGNYDMSNSQTRLAQTTIEGHLTKEDAGLVQLDRISCPLTGIDPSHAMRVQALVAPSNEEALDRAGLVLVGASLYWEG